ncbi:helix-turn-helix domain-containing protein [Actinotalea sp. K2]|uniref:helix-turn-helix domain-containing protein n=1 Tax=Actinotalea sp. K2 TaxID=2939438 RepID=UPI002017AE67|nr:helix-turn-helix domain-containing protein [Actinotalea sp. K2]MCL3861732.1 ArsR family transcriptional regulator [Actinotalea sp. K2]
MRTSAPALVPIFRSALQARLLLRVLTGDGGLTAADLARALGEPEPTVYRETRRLLDAGLLMGEHVGRAQVLLPAEGNPATAPLRQLLVVTYGPSHLVGRALAGITGIEEAYLHGSWAARFHGEPGGPPGDIDVLLVGAPDRRTVDAALEGLEPELGREVNVTYVSPERWRSTDDPFVTTVRARPLVPLELSDHPDRLTS